MEPKPKRSVQITMHTMQPCDSYPTGEMYKVWLIKHLRSGKDERYLVATNNLDTAMDYIDNFLDTGNISEYTQA